MVIRNNNTLKNSNSEGLSVTYTDSLACTLIYILSTNSYNCQMQDSWNNGNEDKGNESYNGYCQNYLRNESKRISSILVWIVLYE